MFGGGLLGGGAAATGTGILAKLGGLFGLGGAAAAGGATATGGTAATTTAAAAGSSGLGLGTLAIPAIYASILGVIASRIDDEDRANAPQRMQSARFGLGQNPGHSSYDPADYQFGAKTVAAAQSMMPNFGVMMASLQTQALNQTVANMASAAKQEPQQVEIKDGKLGIAVTVRDDRTDIRTWVTQQLSHIQINAGATNPGGAGGGK